jgi:large subunit ribosomal protein L24
VKKKSHQKLRIKKGDSVRVLWGKDRGKKGKVIEVLTKEAKVIVEKINVAKKHQKATREFQGGIIEKAIPLPVAKVILVCPRCSEPSRVRKQEVEGKMVRVCASCGEAVDKVK